MKDQSSEEIAEFISRTGNLLIHLLDTCNLHCKHCYLDASQHKNTVLPLYLVKSVIDEADNLGIKSVQFSGGEPFLYPDLYAVLASTQAKKFNVSLSTNGTLINDKIAELLAQMNIFVVVSIDGPPTYHNNFRQREGSFEQTADGIARLIDYGVAFKIVTTVCEDNFQYIDWCAEWAHQMKAAVLQFQPLESVGRGKMLETNRLKEERLYDLFIKASDLAVYYHSKGMKITLTYQSKDMMIAHPCMAFVCNGKECHRGVEKELKKIVIREDGTILPELVDIDRHFTIGNLYQATLKDNILRYLKDGYLRFDQLCREVYQDVVPQYPSPLVPWNEILTERSKSY